MKRIILLTLLVSAVMMGCKKEALITYTQPNSKDNIYLAYKQNINNLSVADQIPDGVVYTFAYTPTLLRDTLWIPVQISGERVSHPRSFLLSVDAASSTAVSAVDYEPLKASYTMPADSGLIHIPLVLLNTDTNLVNNSVRLTLVVSGGTDFTSNLPLYLRSIHVDFSNRLEQPAWWPYWGQLGSYSRVKHQLFLISSGTRDLVELNPRVDPNFYYYIPRCLYYINNVHEFLIDPFNWITQNPNAGYVLTKRTDNTGDYDFYNVSSPQKKFWLKYFPTVNKLIFIDEYGNQILI